ncbi:MAG TPA: HlyD family efflux transporter periplasmic adaptor subunit [Gemmataceae bacterium]|nr:HlyD family efflux transporter periplasmic adaptor subunit [Gemmataceae bacterium]
MKAIRLFIVVLLAASAAGASYYFWPFGREGGPRSFPGIVEIQEIRLGSKVGGRVESVLVLEGEIAEKDQVLVTFEAPELKTQRQQAKARLDLAVADYEKAKAGPRTEEKAAAREALDAAKAHHKMLMVGSREEEKREARSMLQAAEADFTLAREEFDREQRLAGQASSRTNFDTSKANRVRAQRQFERAKAHLDMVLAGTRVEEIEQSEADVRRLQAGYDLLLAGTRVEDMAMAAARAAEARGKLEEYDAMLAETVVRCPEKVQVEVVSVRKGDLIPPNQPILRVLLARDMWVRLYVPETDIWRIKKGAKVQVTVDGSPHLFEGSVMQIASISEFTPRNVQSADERRHQVFGVKILVPNPQGVFKAGMAATVIFDRPLEVSDPPASGKTLP